MFVHRFQVKEKFFLSYFFGKNFEIQDGRQRSHDHPIEKFFKKVFFFTELRVGHALEVKKVS
jgi:hypothetical protein